MNRGGLGNKVHKTDILEAYFAVCVIKYKEVRSTSLHFLFGAISWQKNSSRRNLSAFLI